MNPPAATKGLPFVATTCPLCGHEGRSQYPEFYRCSACYWEASASSMRAKADKMEAKVASLRAEAAVDEKRAAEFRAKHGTTSPSHNPAPKHNQEVLP